MDVLEDAGSTIPNGMPSGNGLSGPLKCKAVQIMYIYVYMYLNRGSIHIIYN